VVYCHREFIIRILVDYRITEDAEPEIGPFAVAVLLHISGRAGLKTIFVATADQGVKVWETAIREIHMARPAGFEHWNRLFSAYFIDS